MSTAAAWKQAAWKQNAALRAIPSHTLARLAIPEPVLPVPEDLSHLLPGGGLKPGTTISVTDSLVLLLALAAPTSEQGAWCAAVGFPMIGALAAEELGIDLERFVLIPDAGPQWLTVVGALMDATSLVLLHPPTTATASDLRRLSTRARERKVVLLTHGSTESAEVELRVTGTRWKGLGQGHGRLSSRELTVQASGRRMPRTRSAVFSP